MAAVGTPLEHIAGALWTSVDFYGLGPSDRPRDLQGNRRMVAGERRLPVESSTDSTVMGPPPIGQQTGGCPTRPTAIGRPLRCETERPTSSGMPPQNARWSSTTALWHPRADAFSSAWLRSSAMTSTRRLLRTTRSRPRRCRPFTCFGESERVRPRRAHAFRGIRQRGVWPVSIPLGSAVAVRRLAATRRGMKSCTSPTPSGIRKRVIRTAVSGR
jgi:hypothetical protein